MATVQRVTPPHPTLTRRRGEETYEMMKPHLDSGQVELLLPSDVPLSLSYLDGIILKLLAAQSLQDVTFVTSDSRIYRHLARIAGIRELDIYARFGEDADRERVEPQPLPIPTKVRPFTRKEMEKLQFVAPTRRGPAGKAAPPRRSRPPSQRKA